MNRFGLTTFFWPSSCPLFYVETLADLAKASSARGTGEDLVQIIASKFPEVGGSPCAEHTALLTGDLLGQHLPMDGRVPRSGGRNVRTPERSGIVFDPSPEEEAFSRWQKHEFQEVERIHAHAWRENLNGLDLGLLAKRAQEMGIDGKRFKTLDEVRNAAEQFVSARGQDTERLALAVEVLRIHPQHRDGILKRWLDEGKPALSNFAPYVAYVLEVEVFFNFALGANLISSDRVSNRVDISYLYYLPFCYVFISGDRLHQKCAPLFMRNNQRFIWGPDLKGDLAKINAYYSKLPEEEREKGIHHFGSQPPTEGDFMVSALWDEFMRPDWRDDKRIDVTPEMNKKIVEELTRFSKAPTAEGDIAVDIDGHENMSMSRMVKRRKGSWWQIGKQIKDHDAEE